MGDEFNEKIEIKWIREENKKEKSSELFET